MFKNNKYTNWYFDIINQAKGRTTEGYCEIHHIIPKSLGGTDEKSNLIPLTAKEHYITHLLLMKMVESKDDRYKMAAAFLYMSTVRNGYTNMRYTSRLYEYHKIIRSKILSERNAGSGNPMFGKHHSDETKLKIAKSNSRCTLTEEGRKKKSNFTKNNNPMSNPILKEKARVNHSKEYIIRNPQGEDVYVKNLAQFCRDNKLHHGTLINEGKTKGWHFIQKLAK